MATQTNGATRASIQTATSSPAMALATTDGGAPLARPLIEFTQEQEKMIRDTFANGASPSEFEMLMAVARMRGLNPITKQIHFVKRWDSMRNAHVWAYQVSIDALRGMAEETGLCDGQDEPEFEFDAKGQLVSVKVRVYRKDRSRPYVGVCYLSEFVQTTKNGTPNSMWATKPRHMLAKCAEALALRKAFPEKTGGLYTDDEMPQDERDVTPQPTRAHPVIARAVQAGRIVAVNSKPEVAAVEPAAVEQPAETEAPEAADIASIVANAQSGESFEAAVNALLDARREGMDEGAFGRLYGMLLERAEQATDFKAIKSMVNLMTNEGLIKRPEWDALTKACKATEADAARKAAEAEAE